jgi:hypothetical protein
MASSTIQVFLLYKPTVTPIGSVILMIAGPPLALVFSLALVSFPGVLRSSPLWLAQARKSNTGLWLWLLLNYIGFACYSKTFIFPSPRLPLFCVTILVPWLLPLTLFIMLD